METPNKETKYIIGVDKGNGASKMSGIGKHLFIETVESGDNKTLSDAQKLWEASNGNKKTI